MISQYIGYLKRYVQEQFHLGLYVSVSVLLALLLWGNYSVEFEDTVMDRYYGRPIQFVYYWLFQGVPYFLACLLIGLFKPKNKFWLRVEFWLISIVGMSVIALDRSFYLHHVLFMGVKHDITPFLIKVVSNMREFVTILSPLFLFFLCWHRKKIAHFYGLRLKGTSFVPYFLMLLVMACGIYFATYNESFMDHYPVYNSRKGELFSSYFGVGSTVPFVIFETVYALSFVMVELLFRGFLVIGLVKYFGDDVVLPMVVTYCVLHFGKPLGESVSSIFGAYILGVIALKSNNIWGGVFVHAGIAVLMDVFAFYTA